MPGARPTEPSPGPLSGYRVIDLTANMSGPYATMVLADQGADVVKVEPPGGEVVRRLGSGRDGVSAYFANLNRTKRSIVVDLKHEEGPGLVRTLVTSADVLVQNFRPGVLESMGLGPDDLCPAFPRLVYLSINGYGRSGPLATEPAYDHVVQALSGIAARQAEPRGGPPGMVRHGLIDKTTGLMAAQAVTAALLARERTGKGGPIEISMLDAALHFMWPDGMDKLTCTEPIDDLPTVVSTYRLTETADGHLAMVTVTDEQWRGLLRAFGRTDVLDDPELQSAQGRMRHGGRVMRELAAEFRRLPTAEVVARLRAEDVPCSEVVALADLKDHPQVVAAGSLDHVEHPRLGPLVQPRPPARFDGLDASRWVAPDAGADTDQVLADAGLGPDEVSRLRRNGVVE
ncbi:MAG: CaiB/BaiF CoA transferase family protein [Acidimicrobiales bacterium]